MEGVPAWGQELPVEQASCFGCWWDLGQQEQLEWRGGVGLWVWGPGQQGGLDSGAVSGEQWRPFGRVWEALAAADAMFRAEDATCWAWSALASMLRMVAWMFSSFFASASWIRSSEEGKDTTAEPALRPSTSETKADRSGTTSARLQVGGWVGSGSGW